MKRLLRCATLLSTALALAPVTEKTAAQVFGRIADKKLLLDVPGAGTPEMKDCCHGGCDNCDYSRIFDEMNAGKPKWVACYLEREHSDGRRHEAPTLSIFGDDADLDVDEFVSRLGAVEPRPPMGAPLKDVLAEFDAEGAAALVSAIAGDGGRVDRDNWGATLRRLSGEEHGITWSAFKPAFVTA